MASASSYSWHAASARACQSSQMHSHSEPRVAATYANAMAARLELQAWQGLFCPFLAAAFDKSTMLQCFVIIRSDSCALEGTSIESLTACRLRRLAAGHLFQEGDGSEASNARVVRRSQEQAAVRAARRGGDRHARQRQTLGQLLPR